MNENEKELLTTSVKLDREGNIMNDNDISIREQSFGHLYIHIEYKDKSVWRESSFDFFVMKHFFLMPKNVQEEVERYVKNQYKEEV